MKMLQETKKNCTGTQDDLGKTHKIFKANYSRGTDNESISSLSGQLATKSFKTFKTFKTSSN